jgi:hypothetical protein
LVPPIGTNRHLNEGVSVAPEETHAERQDFGLTIRSGFAGMGINPFSVDRALSKRPKENREVTSQVQKQFLNMLSEM